MRFIAINDDVCVVTHFTCEKELDTTDIGSAASLSSSTVVTGQSITGEMLVFRKGSLPDMFSRGNMSEKVAIEFVDDDKLYSMDNVLFTSFRELPNAYDKCQAAYTEYVANDIEVSKIVSQTISVGTSL